VTSLQNYKLRRFVDVQEEITKLVFKESEYLLVPADTVGLPIQGRAAKLSARW
jgi:hypothetical protein